MYTSHKCPPRWRVWRYSRDDSPSYDPDDATIVYAEDEEDAGEKFCNSLNETDTSHSIELVVQGEDDEDSLLYVWLEPEVVWHLGGSKELWRV